MYTNKRLLTGMMLSIVFLFINPMIALMIAGGTYLAVLYDR